MPIARRQRQAKLGRCFQVQGQREPRRALKGEFARIRTMQDLVEQRSLPFTDLGERSGP